jgi:hypothetical protein
MKIIWHDMILPPINLWNLKKWEKIERYTPTARRGGRGERGAFLPADTLSKESITLQE